MYDHEGTTDCTYFEDDLDMMLDELEEMDWVQKGKEKKWLLRDKAALASRVGPFGAMRRCKVPGGWELYFYHNRRKTPSFSSGDTALALDSYAVLETWRAPCGHKAEDNFLKIQLLQMAYHI